VAMPDDERDRLAEVVVEVLETQAFLFADRCGLEELITEEEEFLQATIAFEGETRGRMGVAAPRTLCVELAANMLGVEGDDEAALEAAPDALRELANVLCGRLLTALYGSVPAFRLSIPTLEPTDRVGWTRLIEGDSVVGFMVDETPMVAYADLAPAART
jgi:CheY-specific phosphatase CheX